MSEFDLIQDFFQWSHMPDSVRIGVGDDAAILRVPLDKELLISVDTLNAGVHFPLETLPHAIGHKALAVNLSDLAAMGADPAWFTLAVSLPHADKQWLSEFARGLKSLADEHKIFLIGGDTTHGPLSMTIQVIGFAPPKRALLRSNAQHGDLVCVSGTLGDAAAGLAVVQQRLSLPAEAADYCVNRLNYPTPRLLLGRVLRDYAHACMDISDGLLADLGHVVARSGIGAQLNAKSIPFSPALQALTEEQRMPFALTGGDDYELLFTIAPSRFAELQQAVKHLQTLLTVIGVMDKNLSEVSIDYTLSSHKRGYDHFS